MYDMSVDETCRELEARGSDVHSLRSSMSAAAQEGGPSSLLRYSHTDMGALPGCTGSDVLDLQEFVSEKLADVDVR